MPRSGSPSRFWPQQKPGWQKTGFLGEGYKTGFLGEGYKTGFLGYRKTGLAILNSQFLIPHSQFPIPHSQKKAVLYETETARWRFKNLLDLLVKAN
jgi:hypothetical protein